MTYDEFLKTKVIVAPESGFDVYPGEVHPSLKPHQSDAVRWACKGGRRGYTIELNNDYFRDAVGYLRDYEDTSCQTMSLFDLMEGAG